MKPAFRGKLNEQLTADAVTFAMDEAGGVPDGREVEADACRRINCPGRRRPSSPCRALLPE
ncbi:hypothetical protein MES5069_440190 [Mesorhizobium escarrei]|uniref:Uncharacterized protein n=1 Tax=Mesorhizobium escarrei TaxID=666018 RepID=A0ABM9E7Y6_9HYPH|nr:hypothetical protein MES5069_440190 [Mesorhizobium escarrei]